MDDSKAPVPETGGEPSPVVLIQPAPLSQLQPPTNVFYTEQLAPHSFMGLAIVLSIVCFFFYFPCIALTIPAIGLSCMVSQPESLASHTLQSQEGGLRDFDNTLKEAKAIIILCTNMYL